MFLRTLTLLWYIIIYSVHRTRGACPQLFTPVLWWRAYWAFNPIEERQIWWAVDTNSIIDIICHSSRTIQTLFELKIKIFRQIAWDTCLLSPEFSIRTLATFARRVIYSVSTTCITILHSHIPKCSIGTLYTLITSKYRGLYWAVCTLFLFNVINLFFRAA